MSNLFGKAPLAVAIALVTSTQLSHAQMLEEVIVTAQKRAESLQDVPISVSALQGDKISEAGIPNMSAMADYVPNLVITEGTVSTYITMRGAGSGNNQAFEQSVGMYIDGIYMGRGRQYRSPFLDIERVEVLRGPQGTLFGKNTVAGAVSIITASPDVGEEFNGKIDVSAEENGGLIGDLVLSGSPTDNLALRLAARHRETDGYAENTFLGTDEPASEEDMLRLTAVWQPTDNTNINFKYSKNQWEKTGAPSSSWLYLDPESRDRDFPNRSAFASIAYLITDTIYPEMAAEAEKDFTIFKDDGYGPDGKTLGIGINPDGSENDVDNAVLNIEVDMGEHTFTSVTGWSQYTYVDGVDVDWLPLQFIHRDDDQDFEQISQEFRITSPGGEFFDYVGGVYWEQSELSFDRRVTIDTNMGGLVPQVIGANSLLTVLTGGAYTAEQIARNHYYELDASSWAAFFQGTFNLGDSLRLTLGLRYTEETKEAISQQFLSDNIDGLNVPNNNFFLGLIQATNFNTYAYDYDEERDTDAWIPSMNVQWDVSEDSMLYFSASSGFKSGGFTSADDGEPGDLTPGAWPCVPGQPIEACYDPTRPSDEFEFDDEEVLAYEIGGKHTLLDGGMTLNWALFHTEYSDLQTSIFKGVGFGVTNAAESTIDGLEVDMAWQATDRLRLGANAAWLDAAYDSFKDAPCNALQLDADPFCGSPLGVSDNDLSGERTTFAPEITAALFFDYVYTLNSGMEWFLSGEANYRDDYPTSGDNDPLDYSDSLVKSNLRTGLRGADGNWELMLYGRNLSDEQATGNSFDTPVLAGSHSWVFDEGRVLGAKISYLW